MGVGQPKLEIPRQDKLTVRLSKFEREKISRVAKEKNLTITEAILQGIDLLEKNKPKLTRSEFNKLKGIQPKIQQKNSLVQSKAKLLCSTKNNFSEVSL